MHDIKQIRDNPAAFDAALSRRGLEPISASLLEIDAKRRALITDAESALAARNAASKDVGKAKASGDEAEFERLRALVAEKKDEIAQLEAQAKEWDEKLSAELMAIPNLPHDDIPDGADEDDNVEVRRWGDPRQFDFAPKEHYQLAAVAKLLDFETAAKLSGSRFMLLSGALARLHRALAQFMLDTHITEHSLTETWTPVLVRDAALLGTGQLPKFKEDLFKVDQDFWLIPTAEVTLTNIVAGEIIEESYLPRRYCAWTQCFRSEAGSAGRDVAGMLRQHQFEKVEMVSVTKPEDSLAELERMTGCAETILQKLELPYRTVTLCTGDMGFGARKTYDIEVWLPGQDKYREISSCSVCGDFQARRMNARVRRAAKEGQKKGDVEFVHTLNGSGLAVGRALIAVLENYQQEDGAVAIPGPLRGYMGGAAAIGADGALG
ncbi:MAG: serine--tRNA ligase [Rhodobacteraceae bacterium]|nr:serine--tRNA ligase [Paracoccaceae bacterium]